MSLRSRFGCIAILVVPAWCAGAGIADADDAHAAAVDKYRPLVKECIEDHLAHGKGVLGDIHYAGPICRDVAGAAAMRDLYVAFRKLERWLADDAKAHAQWLRAQRAWLEYRDDHCALEDRIYTSTVAASECRLQLNAQRAVQLDALLAYRVELE
jgi:uncharacterized protein YecT (DUF1311 family)